jgi:solute:Na+ symporter, SSS family
MDPMLLLDVGVFLGFIIAVIAVGIGMSRGENDSEDYFLAGRDLKWWLIGFSLIAANISSEQFIGMSGQAADYVGLAIASYEWMAAITLVVVAFFFLPKFLRAGIYTIPEFLEYRFTHSARTLMSAMMVLTCVLVSFTGVVYSGALTAVVLYGDEPLWGGFQLTITNASWIIGVLAAVYVVAGGLKACAWADLLQGSALIVGGGIVAFLAFRALGAAEPAAIGLADEHAAAGALERFQILNSDRMHMVLPSTDMILPWTALVLGLWIPNFYYWGLNQYITQRTLGANSLADGQNGVVFAAAMKLIIPFIIVIPGIIAFNLYANEMRSEAGRGNRAKLERLEEANANPAEAKVAFQFDSNFAKLHPAETEQMLAVNQALAGDDVTRAEQTPEALTAHNAALLAAIATKNSGRPVGEQVRVLPSVQGYKFDSAFPLLMKHLVVPGVRGFVLAALFGRDQLAGGRAQRGVDDVHDGSLQRVHEPQCLAGQPGHCGAGLCCGFHDHRLYDLALSRRSAFSGDLQLHSRIPGFHFAGRAGRVHLWAVRPSRPARLRHCGIADLPDRLRRFEGIYPRRRLLESDGDYIWRHPRHTCADDAGQAAGHAGDTTRAAEDRAPQLQRGQDVGRNRGDRHDCPVCDILLGRRPHGD